MADEATAEVDVIDASGGISDEALGAALDAAERKSDTAAAEAPEKEASTPEGGASAIEGADVEPTEVSPPEHWSAEDKEAFGKLDSYAREVLLQREKNFTKGLEEKSTALKRYEDALKPYGHLLTGADPVQAIDRLFKAQAYLQSNPVEGIKWLMQSYNVDGSQFAPKPAEQDRDDEFLDPEVKRLRQELKDARDEQAQKERQAEQRRQQEQFAMIGQFKSAAGDDGQPLHPHFDDLQPIMAGLLSAGRAADLEDAYAQALKAHPTYIDAEIERRTKERADAEAKKAAAEAEKAAAASKKAGGTTDAKKPATGDSWEKALEDNYDRSVKGEL